MSCTSHLVCVWLLYGYSHTTKYNFCYFKYSFVLLLSLFVLVPLGKVEQGSPSFIFFSFSAIVPQNGISNKP
jgi:hypothetical protein